MRKLLPLSLWNKVAMVRRFPTLTRREKVAWLKSIGKHMPIETDPFTRVAIFTELQDWESWYLPPDGVKGKRILDIGAGSGETAWFFLDHGASSVVCVEPDRGRFEMLLRNAKKFDWPVECYNRNFILSDLFSHHTGLAKIDCEGGEDALLDLSEDQLPPLLMEIHYQGRYETFRAKYPNMQIIRPDSRELWMARWKA